MCSSGLGKSVYLLGKKTELDKNGRYNTSTSMPTLGTDLKYSVRKLLIESASTLDAEAMTAVAATGVKL